MYVKRIYCYNKSPTLSVTKSAMNTSLSQSVSNSDLSLNNLPNSSENTLPNTINPKENISKSQNSVLKFFSDYFEYLKTVLIAILISGLRASGPIPKHVAIIMDGNRRYAKKKGFAHVSEGHFEGAKTLEKLLDYGFRLGVKHLTVFAFSIENFKRPAEEVDVLMSLTAEKLQILSQKNDLIKKHQVRINVIGAIQMLPRHVQVSAAKAMLSTIHHENFVLNICFPYTSTYEISEACKSALKYTKETLNPLPVFDNPTLFDCFLDTWDSSPLDILIRTSGESRLSEFLMWQVCRNNRETGRLVQVHILNALWPEFGFNHLIPIILKYQSTKTKDNKTKPDDLLLERDIEELREWRRNKKLEFLQTIANQ